MSIRQNAVTMEKYGKRVEQLFVELTMAQANGNDGAFEVFKPVPLHKPADGKL